MLLWMENRWFRVLRACRLQYFWELWDQMDAHLSPLFCHRLPQRVYLCVSENVCEDPEPFQIQNLKRLISWVKTCRNLWRGPIEIYYIAYLGCRVWHWVLLTAPWKTFLHLAFVKFHLDDLQMMSEFVHFLARKGRSTQASLTCKDFRNVPVLSGPSWKNLNAHPREHRSPQLRMKLDEFCSMTERGPLPWRLFCQQRRQVHLNLRQRKKEYISFF